MQVTKNHIFDLYISKSHKNHIFICDLFQP